MLFGVPRVRRGQIIFFFSAVGVMQMKCETYLFLVSEEKKKIECV